MGLVRAILVALLAASLLAGAPQTARAADAVLAFERGMSLGSVNGVFTVRNSYPLALRVLGRQTEADRAASTLATTTATPSTVVQSPDSFALILVTRRAHEFDELQRLN